MNLIPIGKFLIIIGFIIIIIGFSIIIFSKIPYFGKLPGDIIIKREKFSIYFPLVTCIALSIILSAVFFVINRLRH